MPRLINSISKVVVNVDDEFAERLRGAGWADVKESAPKAPAKLASKSASKKNN